MFLVFFCYLYAVTTARAIPAAYINEGPTLKTANFSKGRDRVPLRQNREGSYTRIGAGEKIFPAQTGGRKKPVPAAKQAGTELQNHTRLRVYRLHEREGIGPGCANRIPSF